MSKMSMRSSRTRSFAGQSRETRHRRDSGKGGSGAIIEGRFNRFTPTETPTWLHFPDQAYTFPAYNPKTKKVETIEDSPYLEFVQHFIANSKTSDKRRNRPGVSFVCSSGPDKSAPCYGCATRQRYFDDKREAEDRGETVKGDSPVGGGPRYGLAMTVAELVAHVPVFDDRGKPRTNKRGAPIFNQIPVPRLNEQDPDVVESYRKTFGWAGHWNFSGSHLIQLEDLDFKLRNFCGNCAAELYAIGWVCNECGELHEETEEVQGIDFEEGRKKLRKCRNCGAKGTSVDTPEVPAAFTVDIACGDCGKAVEGGLLGWFDLRIKAKPAGAPMQSSILELCDLRPTLATRKEPEYEDFAKMAANPIDIQKIFTPESIEGQRKLFDSAFIEDIDPAHTRWVESYSESENIFDEDED